MVGCCEFIVLYPLNIYPLILYPLNLYPLNLLLAHLFIIVPVGIAHCVLLLLPRRQHQRAYFLALKTVAILVQ
jgi:hypothetical protein